MQIVSQNIEARRKAIEILKNGGLIIFPCETVYGVAVDSGNSSAISKLNNYKKRPLGKPYAIMCSDIDMAKKYVVLNKTAENLYKKFLPGPLTIISKGKNNVSKGIESETGTLGVRIPKYPFMQDLIKEFGRPIAATSANPSYQKRPYKLDDIFENISLKQKVLIDLAIDAGELPHNEPSTVIDTTADDSVVLRQGDIRISNSNRVLSRSEENTQNVGKEIWQKYEKYQGKRSIVFALQGDMGAGKTQFTKGLAKAMGITELVNSPTYALENEYKTNNAELFHFDAWRLEVTDNLESLGFTDLVKNKSVIAVEWADKVQGEIRRFDEEALVIWVRIEQGNDENERIIVWDTI